MLRLLLRLPFCSLLLLTTCSLAGADDLTLAWDPPGGDLPKGYYLRYGPWPGAFTQRQDAGASTTLKVSGLLPGTTYQFHVVAYDQTGLTSGPSNVVKVTMPTSGGDWPAPPSGSPPAPLPEPTNGATPPGPSSPDGPLNDVPASQPYRLYLAEGAQSRTFHTRLSLANPHQQAASATIVLRPAEGSRPLVQSVEIAPRSQIDVDASSLTGGHDTSFGVEVGSTRAIGVSRTMAFSRGGGGHSEVATSAASRRWYFAEGATHGRFELFYLLFNPGTAPATVSMTYLLPTGPSSPRHHEIAPRSRLTVWVDQEGPGFASTEMATVIESVSGPPIVAERAMYLTGGSAFVGGHVALGATEPRSRWLMAEGATGAYFQTYVLLANPHKRPVPVALTFTRPDGIHVRRTVVVPGRSRRTVNVADVHKTLENTAVWTEVRAPEHLPIVAERVTWWPGTDWQDGHASAGITRPAARWLAVGAQNGGARSHATYVLAVNDSDAPQMARVTVLGKNGPAGTLVVRIPPHSRYTVDTVAAFPQVQGTFSVMVEAIGGEGQLIVEQSTYWDAEGRHWAAGTAMPAMPLAR